jgi:hypothetical protein
MPRENTREIGHIAKPKRLWRGSVLSIRRQNAMKRGNWGGLIVGEKCGDG